MTERFYTVGIYPGHGNTILNFPGDGPNTITFCRRQIRWQEHPGSTTDWRICEPDPDAPDVMIDHATGERITINQTSLTPDAAARLRAEIWPS